MKCWVDGSKCLIQAENKSYGLLNVTDSFCRGCFVFDHHREGVECVLERVGIEFLQDVEEPLISEEEQIEIIENVGIILQALNHFKKVPVHQGVDEEAKERAKLAELIGLFEKLK
jgi:hypothetical protein